jgi:MFS family permease
MEVWPARARPLMAGIIGAASNVGFLLISFVCWLLPVSPASWRWVMLAGAVPALLTFFVRIFVPESPRWTESQKHGPTRPLREAFTGKTAGIMLLSIVFASVALLGTWGAVQKIPAWLGSLPGGREHPAYKAIAGMLLGGGAIIGCLIAPFIGSKLGRRPAYFLLCLASLVICEFLFRGFASVTFGFWIVVFLVGAVTAAFYGWLPLYLPELFPTRIRATAQGIAFNFGRIFAAAGALMGGQLVELWGDYGRMAAALSLIYVLGMILIWLAPETKGRPLPD